MKIHATLGNPFLIFLYSLAILVLGCAIGIHWKAASGTAFCLAVLGALLMVIHDLAMGVLWFWVVSRRRFWSSPAASPSSRAERR